jgi:hypothetical protein
VVGVVRVDGCGALMLSSGCRVVQVEADLIRYANGLAFRREGCAEMMVPVWRFSRATALATGLT